MLINPDHLLTITSRRVAFNPVKLQDQNFSNFPGAKVTTSYQSRSNKALKVGFGVEPACL